MGLHHKTINKLGGINIKEMKMNIKKSDISDANIERLTKLYKQDPTPEKQKELEMLINLSTIVNIGNDMFNSK